MVKFVNLTKLELDVVANWYNVVKFLKVADNLEVLIINIRDMPPYKEPKRVPTCMLARLRTVRMYYFCAREGDFEVVKYILRNAQVLERMEICPLSDYSIKRKFDALQRISLFKRVFKSCEVAFNTDEVVRDMINELNRTERESEEEKEIVCTFPRLPLTCKTLVDLRLVNCGVIPSTWELFLPSLKKLNLSYVDYESDESLPHLLSGCPVLEELIVNDCFRVGQKNSGCVIVTSLTLKILNVEFYDGNSQHLEETLIIDVPALVNLKVGHCDLDSIKSLRKTMTSLDKAEIDICVDWHVCDIDCYEHDSSIEFLSCLCNVRYLKITSDLSPLVGIVGTGSMPMFINLTKLELNLTFNWYDVVKFLEVADNLEVLIIDAYKTIPCDEPVPYNEPKHHA